MTRNTCRPFQGSGVAGLLIALAVAGCAERDPPEPALPETAAARSGGGASERAASAPGLETSTRIPALRAPLLTMSIRTAALAEAVSPVGGADTCEVVCWSAWAVRIQHTEREGWSCLDGCSGSDSPEGCREVCLTVFRTEVLAGHDRLDSCLSGCVR